MSKIVRLKSLILEEIGDDILNIRLKDDAMVEKSDMQEYLAAIKSEFGGRSFKNLVEFGSYSNVTPEARVFAGSIESNSYTLADAFVLHSLSQRILGNFYMKFDKPAKPTQIFSDREEALKWLKTLD